MNERQREAIRFLRMNPKADLYECAAPGDSTLGSGEYQVSYGGGKGPTLTRADVHDLILRNLIRHKWPDRPEVSCYVLTPKQVPTGASTDG